jgi:hypothetical protein
MALEPLIYIGVKAHEDYGPRKEPAEGRLEYGNCIINRHRYNLYHTQPRLWDPATYIRGLGGAGGGHPNFELVNPSSVSSIQSDSYCLSEPSNSSSAPLPPDHKSFIREHCQG